jgi:hypothetical protein
MPGEELSVRHLHKGGNVTHLLHPGAMHCDAEYKKVQLDDFLLASSCPMTYIYTVAPRNLFAWRVAPWYGHHSHLR